MPQRYYSRRLLVGLAWALFVLPHPAGGQGYAKSPPETPGEYDVKAAFLLNFTRFVEWPSLPGERAATPFSICLLGKDPFGASLNQIVADETIGGRQLVIKRIRTWPDTCDMLFIPASEPSQKTILSQAGRDVLTVGESPDFLRNGGMIRFVLEDQRVRFDISRQAVDRSLLKMSARLLGVARIVQ